MIFDRTQNDVIESKRIISQKVKQNQPLTELEISILEKGTMTVNTLNRIEQKQEELKSLLNNIGYWNNETQNKTWDENGIFYVEDFQRLLDNINVLRNAFFTYKSTPKTPNISYHYNNLNSIEKILYDIDAMIEDVKSNYRECGTIECGV